VTKCTICHQGINSTYIRVGEKSLLNKIGFYCGNCDIYYDLNQKPYTKNEKPYTVNKIEKPNSSPFLQNKRALAGIWTRDLCLTKATLYQAELPRQTNKIANAKHST
jgi:hypothetical protein